MLPLRLVVISLALTLAGCASTGPADDGFENSNESVDIGKLPTGDLIGQALKKINDATSSTGQTAEQ